MACVYGMAIGVLGTHPMFSAPNCIKDFLDLPDDTGQSGLTVPFGDSSQSCLALQLFPLETIVTSNLIGQNKRIVQ